VDQSRYEDQDGYTELGGHEVRPYAIGKCGGRLFAHLEQMC